MKIRPITLILGLAMTLSCLIPVQGAGLPGESSVEAIEYEYFPSRMHAFVFRNWSLVPVQRLAEVLNTTPNKVIHIAKSMGLDAKTYVDPIWLSSRGYITVLRRNWHILQYEQLLTLLGISEEELSWRLQEDDFLFVKLGSLKPHCEKLTYEKPNRAIKQKSRDIKRTVRATLKDRSEMVPRFDLFRDVRKDLQIPESEELRMVFSYNAEYGDPLMDDEQGSYSDELLNALQNLGINAVWVHSVLRTLVPPNGIFPGDTLSRRRIANLNTLVHRAEKYGIKVFLYVNEPRSMPNTWFDTPERKALAGVEEDGFKAICTSNPQTLEWLSNSFSKVFEETPGLGGVFTVSASENLTNCASHDNHAGCGMCRNREYADIIADVNNAIAKGVKRAAPDAQVIVWDWGWDDDCSEAIINRLSKDCMLMSVSEWSIPIERGGIASKIGEYSISTPGPGPRARAHWEYAQKAGLKTVAKVMANTTWELGSVPVIPAVDLIAHHARNISHENVDGVVMSWSLGGYPSINLALWGLLLQYPEADLHDLAVKIFGEKIADYMESAWTLFSDGFAEFPYSMKTVYCSPHHLGPANPFYLQPSGYRSSMVGLPYDDVESWVSVFPPEVYISQMNKISDNFDEGIKVLEEAYQEASLEEEKLLDVEIIRAKAISAHFKSAANQVVFTQARNVSDYRTMSVAVEKEKKITSDYLDYVLADPTLGYESSNHYFFVPQDIIEKIINLEYISKELASKGK